ncbi:transcriptional regulator [Formosa sediminum]|uniref:Transcriptional regulator n=1 Tax=Formosa sediminum TaxID=2594004 RepID=A0A516GVG3_9FLAO|nr:DUF6377 domain-containing protein [Formosa sediminum]QDO95511.1 transcriptional regulator [Formosa sediminum]
MTIYKTLLLAILFNVVNPIYASNELDSLIVKLEHEMAKRDIYDQAKEQRITNLKVLFSEPNVSLENQYFLTKKLINEYEYYSFDSTLYYIEENLAIAKKIGNSYFINESTLRLAKLLATSGRYDESIKLLEDISSKNLSDELIREYYSTYKRCYSELRTISTVKNISEKYNKLYYVYKDSLNAQISKLDPNSDLYLKLIEQNYRDVYDNKKALEINTKRLSLAKMGTRDFAMVAFDRSYMSYEIEGNRINQKKYLILSAISDIQASVKDNASMSNLAVILFEEGDVDKAHNYISFTFEDAKFYNSKLRFLDISNVLPVIAKSYEIKNVKQNNRLKKQIIFISILSLILALALFFIFKQFNKIKLGREHLKTANLQLKDLNEQLNNSNNDLKRLYNELSAVDTIKEQYVGTFLNLYSEYIDKLDNYRKNVRKYIVTNKTNDLLELVKSKNIVDDELKLFYTNFDKSFLHIYPNFIEGFNELLKDEGKIVIKKENTLTVELRIFALIRLGIVNSSKISKILRYSVNTIYNYRVKVRNNAKDREEFEDMVKKIM